MGPEVLRELSERRTERGQPVSAPRLSEPVKAGRYDRPKDQGGCGCAPPSLPDFPDEIRMYRPLCLTLAFALLPSVVVAQGQPRPWTLDEVRQELKLSPRDPYLQYVGLQLSRRDHRQEEFANQIDGLRGRDRGRGNDVDVFGLFTGALAVQESLQLDTLRRGEAGPRPEVEGADGPSIDISTLSGPTIQSHPWKEMLAGRQPAVTAMSLCVPEDFYLVEFAKLTKMMSVLESGDLWTTHFTQQVDHSAHSQDLADRLRRQLAVKTSGLLRPFYDKVVGGVGISGSDLYVREGSDVTLLFELKEPEVFRARMDALLSEATKNEEGAVRKNGEILGIEYDHVTTPDRSVHVFSAYPRPDLHVRSNSEVALERILAAIGGAEGVRRLGETDEYAYIRTLMPRGAELEDGLVYLSDPFIRRIVGPQVKLTELRRMQCYNHLCMIGRAALLHRTQRGQAPASLEALAEAECAPGVFGTGELLCPDGGTYALSSDAQWGTCTHHGHARSLTPCCEIPIERVSAEERRMYHEFLSEYNRYWRVFFDPIVMRISSRPERYRIETLILPLIDNSIYSNLAEALGGEPEQLDALPVPTANILSVGVKFDKDVLLGGMDQLGHWAPFDVRNGVSSEDVRDLVSKGLGNQVSLNVCDTDPLFDFSLPGFLGRALGSFNARGSSSMDEIMWIGFFVTALSAPVYVSMPVADETVVDAFLDKLDASLAVAARQPERGGWISERYDFYGLPAEDGQRIRCGSVGFGPLKWRLFWARIDGALHVASKKWVLRDLAAAHAPEAGPVGHAMIRMRPKHWAAVLQDYELGWAENNRLACLGNVGPLSNVARALAGHAAEDAGERMEQVAGLAAAIYGARQFCPEGGSYSSNADGSVSCEVHGTPAAPRQPAGPVEESSAAKALRTFRDFTAALTFTPEGLRAVVTIDRR